LSEIHYPGWKALVDGQPAAIRRGNYLFRVIHLSPGQHDVQVLFDPPSVKMGIGITTFFLMVLLLALTFQFRKRSPS